MKSILPLLITIIFISSCLYSDSEPRMINMKRLLEAYGYDNGIFYGTKDIRTAEEFITASLFTAMFAWEEEIVEEELPRNKEGVLRVCSMWLLKIAEQPENKEKYLDRIESIKEAAKVEHTYVTAYKKYEFKSIHVTDEEIREYYESAIKNTINSMEIRDVNDSEKKQAKMLLINYCIQPNKENRLSLKEFNNKLLEDNKVKSDGFLAFIYQLSPIIRELIMGEIPG